MGKQTKKEKATIRFNLDVQMNLASDLVSRNPWMKDLHEKYPHRFIDKVLNPSTNPYYEEYDKRFAEIYGDIFPTFPFPVQEVKDSELRKSELVLRIDLNYTKDEILNVVEQFVDMALEQYRKNRTQRIIRKIPRKWTSYLEIWDLKDGYPPWFEAGGIKLPPARKKSMKGPWTYEEIAKHMYPDMQSPRELEKAIDKVKKDYRAGCKLICGRKYDPQEMKKQKAFVGEKNDKTLCDQCPDRPICKTLCPALMAQLVDLEVTQQHKIVAKLEDLDLETYQKIRKKIPTAEQQFDRMR